MYNLILSREERKAIDWIGDLYSHGNDLRRILEKCKTDEFMDYTTFEKDEKTWDYEGEITFMVPESIAWEIWVLISASNLEYFRAGLKYKLFEFCGKIV